MTLPLLRPDVVARRVADTEKRKHYRTQHKKEKEIENNKTKKNIKKKKKRRPC